MNKQNIPPSARPAGGPFQAIAFDFNGVIVDDEMLHYEAFRRAIQPYGGTISEAQYVEKYLSYDDRRVVSMLADEVGAPDEFDDILASKISHYMNLAGGEPPFFPGAVGLIERLSSSVRMGIVSGARREEIELILTKGRIRDCFEFIVAAEDTDESKPSPKPYLKSIEQFELESGEIAAVEDSLGGIKSAKEAGLHVFAVTHSYPAEKLSEADIILTTLSDLERLVT